MILEYEEAVEQALGAQQLQMFDIASLVGFLLLMAAPIMCAVFENMNMNTKRQVCIIAITCVVGGALLISPQCIKGDALKNAGLGNKSSYYSSQIEEKYDMYVLPNMSTNPFLRWWKQEFYAVSNETDEVKTYRLEETNEGYLTLIDTKDGKALDILKIFYKMI